MTRNTGRTKRLLGGAFATVILAILGGCAASPGALEVSAPGTGASEVELVAAGRTIAVQRCASCHGIDQANTSPLREAATFRTILAQYRSDVLAEDLIEGIQMGHDEMPLFDFTVTAADALVAYLKSLQQN